KRAARMVAYDERDIVLAQQRVDLGREPARMTKLECMTPRGQLGESRCEALVVPVEGLRQLPQDRSQAARLHSGLQALVEPRHARPWSSSPSSRPGPAGGSYAAWGS